MVAKGRQAKGDSHGKATHPESRVYLSGEKNGQCKLTAKAVAAIRFAARGGEMQQDISARFGVSPMTVSLIVRRKRWGHVP